MNPPPPPRLSPHCLPHFTGENLKHREVTYPRSLSLDGAEVTPRWSLAPELMLLTHLLRTAVAPPPPTHTVQGADIAQRWERLTPSEP